MTRGGALGGRGVGTSDGVQRFAIENSNVLNGWVHIEESRNDFFNKFIQHLF